MGLSLTNIGKKLWDQVNTIDNGRTWSNSTPQNSNSAFQQLRQTGNSVINAATEYPLQLANTAKAGAGAVYGLGKVGVAKATNNPIAYVNAINRTQAGLNKDLSSRGGFAHKGSFFKDANEAHDISVGGITKKAIGKGLEGVPYVLSDGATGLLAKPAEAAGTSIFKGLVVKAADEGIQNAVASAGQTLADGGNVKDTAKAAGIGFVTGAPNALTHTNKLLKGKKEFIAGENATRFKQAEKAGAVYKGADGKPRFEGSDNTAKVRRLNEGYNDNLSNVLVHPTLYHDYPQLANVRVSVQKLPKGAKAVYLPDRNHIVVNPAVASRPDTFKDALLHETQHAIQNAEGFAQGTNISDRSAYAANLGEQEARQVQARASMTPAERRINPMVDQPQVTLTQPTRQPVAMMSDDDLNTRINQQVKQTKDNLKVSGMSKVRNKVAETLDPLYEAVKIDHADAAKQRIKYRDLPASQRLDFALDKTRYSARQARQLLDDNGVSDVIKKYPGAKEHEFVNYLNARFALEVGDKRGIQLIPGETPDTLNRYIKDFEAANPGAVKDAALIKAHADSLLDRGSKSGLIPKDEADFVKGYYKNYVPISRVIPDDLARPNIEGRALGSIGKQKILQDIENVPTRDTPLDNTFDSILKRTEATVKQSNLADAQRLYADKVARGVAPGRVLQDSDTEIARAQKKVQLKDIRGGVESLKAKLKISNRQAKVIDRELNKLNKEGLKVSLKQKSEPNLAGKLVDPGLKTPPNELKSVLENLVNQTPADLQRIRNKIATREPKLAAKIDKVIDLQNKMAENQDAKAITRQEISQSAPSSTVGKQVVSGLNKGVPYKIETTPEIARMLQGLDETKKGALEKGFGAPMKVFQTAWTGAINPVFSAISFAFYDLPMSAINSTQGLKVFAPKAVGEMFRSFNANSDFQKALARSGAQITGGSQLPVNARLTAQSIAAERNIASRFKFNATNPAEALRNLDVLGGKLSNATRTRVARAHFDDAIKQGATKEQALAEAAQAYNNVLPNYGRVAPLVKNLNAIIPYSGASIAGTRSLLRAIKDDPAATVGKIAGLTIAPAVGTSLYSLSNPQGQEFYQDMVDSNRQYTLDNNLVIVLPGAHKDTKTGAWSGVIKVPVPPEMRAVNAVSWRAAHDFTTKGQDQLNPQEVAGAAFDFMTGGLRTGGNPVLDTYRIGMNQSSQSGGQVTNENSLNLDKKDQTTTSTTAAAKNLAKISGYKLSPTQVDKVLQQFGFPGQLIQNREDNYAKTALASVKNRFEGAYGQSQGSRYFNSIDETAKDQRLAGKDVDVLKSLLDREVDLNGNPVKQNDKDALFKYSALTNNPRVAKVISDAAKKRAKATGEALDPLYNLSDSQQNTYYRIQATPYKSDDYTQLTNANPWLDDFKSQRANYFKKNPLTPGNTDKVPYPTFSSATQANMDSYFNIDDSKDKAQFMADHPDVQSALNEMSQYGNDRREATGYARLKGYPEADGDTKKIMDAYNALPTGDGKKGGNATRYAWIQSHPTEYKKMQDYYAKTSEWQLANSAGADKYEGATPSQAMLKSAYSLGQYDIAKTKDANGKAVFSLDPAAAYAQNNSSSKGGSKNYFANTESYRVATPKKLRKPKVSLKKGKLSGKKFKVKKISQKKNAKITLKT